MTFPDSPPSLEYVQCADTAGGHRMAYWQWGNPLAAHVVLCVHGLSRQGRDFDVLAAHLVDAAKGNIRVICPDVVGRGESDWLKDPMGYQITHMPPTCWRCWGSCMRRRLSPRWTGWAPAWAG